MVGLNDWGYDVVKPGIVWAAWRGLNVSAGEKMPTGWPRRTELLVCAQRRSLSMTLENLSTPRSLPMPSVLVNRARGKQLRTTVLLSLAGAWSLPLATPRHLLIPPNGVRFTAHLRKHAHEQRARGNICCVIKMNGRWRLRAIKAATRVRTNLHVSCDTYSEFCVQD